MKILPRLIMPLALSTLLFTGCSNPPADNNPDGATNTPAAVATEQAPETAETPETAGSDDESGFMVVDSKGTKLEFTPSTSKIDLRRDNKKSTIVLGNYDFQLAPMSANSIAALTAPEQTRIHVGVDASKAEGVAYETPLPPGEYQATFVDVLTFDGAEARQNFENEKGTITIVESSDDQVKGTVDITADGGAVVKGEFTAEVAK